MKKIYLHVVNGFAEIKSRIRNVLSGEEGMGTVEVILIILVLIGLVIIFKNCFTLPCANHTFENNEAVRQHIRKGESCAERLYYGLSFPGYGNSSFPAAHRHRRACIMHTIRTINAGM